jgi:hypothetical protein
MRALSWTAILLVNTFLLQSVPARAAPPGDDRLNIRPRTATILPRPDLVIQNVTYGTAPKAGDRIGATTIFNVQIRNAGNAAAPKNRLKITCTPLGATSCAPELSGSLPVSPLVLNGQYGLTWPRMSQNKWAAGRYRLTFEVDADHTVAEKQEGNNVRSLIINVPSPPALSMANPKKPKLSKPSLAKQLKNCSLQDIKITSPQDYSIHYLADNVTVKWSGTSDKTCKLAVNLRKPGGGLTWQTKNTGSYTFKPPVTLNPSRDLGDAYTLWLSPPNNTQQQLTKTRILLKKPTEIPPGACSGAESCPTFNNTWTDLKPTGFAVSYPSTPDTIHFQIRWKNTGPQCLPVVRWRITENGRGIKEGSYIAGGASATSFSVLGCQEMMIEGAVRKSEFKHFFKCQNSSDQCSKAVFTIDSDNSVVETEEHNNMKVMVFRWRDPWPQ